MKNQILISITGESFNVADFIIRIESATGQGWQLRYGEWRMFDDSADGSDGQSGADKAFAMAMDEMQFRLNTLGK